VWTTAGPCGSDRAAHRSAKFLAPFPEGGGSVRRRSESLAGSGRGRPPRCAERSGAKRWSFWKHTHAYADPKSCWISTEIADRFFWEGNRFREFLEVFPDCIWREAGRSVAIH